MTDWIKMIYVLLIEDMEHNIENWTCKVWKYNICKCYNAKCSLQQKGLLDYRDLIRKRVNPLGRYNNSESVCIA